MVARSGVIYFFDTCSDQKKKQKYKQKSLAQEKRGSGITLL